MIAQQTTVAPLFLMGEKRDKQRLITPKVNRLFKLIQRLNHVMLELNMRYEGVRDLSMIVNYWQEYRLAISRYTLTQITSEFNTTTYQAGTKRINVMLRKGLILRVGHSRYIPTDKAIDLLNSIKI